MKAFFVCNKLKQDIMKKMQLLIAMFFMVLLATSCEETSIKHEGPAHIVLTNITTGKEVSFDGTNLEGKPKTLDIRNNDSLKVLFVPEQDYVKYGFEVTFTLFDNTKIVDKEYPFRHKMLVKDIIPGTYTISCHAIAKTAEVDITETGQASITVME